MFVERLNKEQVMYLINEIVEEPISNLELEHITTFLNTVYSFKDEEYVLEINLRNKKNVINFYDNYFTTYLQYKEGAKENYKNLMTHIFGEEYSCFIGEDELTH